LATPSHFLKRRHPERPTGEKDLSSSERIAEFAKQREILRGKTVAPQDDGDAFEWLLDRQVSAPGVAVLRPYRTVAMIYACERKLRDIAA
jgi:hypothetical protein